MTTTSSRILLDIPCKVCQDHSSGKHYGIFACDGCAGFFKRSIRRQRNYVCKNRGNSYESKCTVDKTHRNQCRACRLTKCVTIGMNQDAVQHERGPRNSTLRRQMAMYFKDSSTNHLNFLRPNLPPFGHVPPPPHPLAIFPTIRPVFPVVAPFLRFGHPVLTAPMFTVDRTANSVERRTSETNVDKLLPTSKDHSLKEQAARLLFMSVNWPKSLPQFVILSLHEQTTIVGDTWSELFLLAAAQFGLLTRSSMLSMGDEIIMDRFRRIAEHLHRIQPDAVEYSCLRALVLLKENAVVLEQMHNSLSRYAHLQYGHQPFRCFNVISLLAILKEISPTTLEQLFFKDSIGDLPMSRLVRDLYQSVSMNTTINTNNNDANNDNDTTTISNLSTDFEPNISESSPNSDTSNILEGPSSSMNVAMS